MLKMTKRRLTSLRVAIPLGLIALAIAAPSGAFATPATTVVKPSSMHGWFFFNDNTNAVDNTLGSFTSGPASAPLGNGSVRINAASGDRVLLATTAHNGLALSNITTLSYSTYRSSPDRGQQPGAQRPAGLGQRHN